jgi:hypothetical protein
LRCSTTTQRDFPSSTRVAASADPIIRAAGRT